jgi:hypothetical protein
MKILMPTMLAKSEEIKAEILGALSLFNDAVCSSKYLVSNNRLIMNN